MCAHICTPTYDGTHVEVKVQFAGVSFPSLPNGLWGLNLDHHSGGILTH